MTNFTITTDSTCDLPQEYIQEHDIKIIPLCYSINDVVYDTENQLEPHNFYDLMRSGAMPTTMASTPQFIEDTFRTILEGDSDILHIGFSSGLSSSLNSAMIVSQNLSEEFPNRQIIVIDSLAAALGQGLFVHKAIQKRNDNFTLQQTADWLESHKQNFCHMFTVDDLNHLHRGGRISKATAIMGTLINIKPILHVDSEGYLQSLSKVRGRKKSLSTLVDNMAELSVGFENDIVFIGHGDCLEDAQYIAKLVEERFNIHNFLINHISPTIGSHTGPNVVALFFMGQHR